MASKKRKQFNVRLPLNIIAKIKRLSPIYGSQSAVIVIAVSRLYDMEFTDKSASASVDE